MTQNPLTGVVLDEGYEVTITEICRACGGSTEWVIELVQEGVLEPADEQEDEWRFSAVSLQRARAAMRLQQDLGVNLAGIALALDMMDELDRLRARLQRLDPDHPA
ncbi:MAG: MerR family transcriptional regulator [Woeseia sp.]|nr:chaperone modulator CbpM [Woeseia sp.]MBT8095721.1 chaperone modulator CbpM [Woeseia sp.]NNE61354.1 MerR family transcriptional regulator [Woeseia sp.]NNL55905.1 MerR family transcriptional regulator [Woeseia sp.]